jgi:hypothetical protein
MTTTQINWPTRIRIVVEAVEGFDLFGLVDPDA